MLLFRGIVSLAGDLGPRRALATIKHLCLLKSPSFTMHIRVCRIAAGLPTTDHRFGLRRRFPSSSNPVADCDEFQSSRGGVLLGWSATMPDHAGSSASSQAYMTTLPGALVERKNWTLPSSLEQHTSLRISCEPNNKRCVIRFGRRVSSERARPTARRFLGPRSDRRGSRGCECDPELTDRPADECMLPVTRPLSCQPPHRKPIVCKYG